MSARDAQGRDIGLGFSTPEERAEAAAERRAALVETYITTGSVVEAAEAAGVTKKQAENMLRTQSVVQLLNLAYQKAGISADSIAQVIADGMKATRTTVVALGDGQVHVSETDDHQIRLQAAKLALDQAGKWADRQLREEELAMQAERKHASQMTLEELARAVTEQTARQSQ